MTKQYRTHSIKRDGRVNRAKSELLNVLRDIESSGLAREALALSNIIGRLEDWQNRK